MEGPAENDEWAVARRCFSAEPLTKLVSSDSHEPLPSSAGAGSLSTDSRMRAAGSKPTSRDTTAHTLPVPICALRASHLTRLDGSSSAAQLILASLFLTLLALPVAISPVEAQTSCEFVLGFATLRDLASPQLVGACREDEHHGATGDALQQTTDGLL